MIEVTTNRFTRQSNQPFVTGNTASVYFKFAQAGKPETFAPPINAYLLADRIEVCVDLAGIEVEAMQITAQQNRLTIRGVRQTPCPARQSGDSLAVLAMEIDHGPFERVLELPKAIDPDQVSAEHVAGLLWIRMPLRQ